MQAATFSATLRRTALVVVAALAAGCSGDDSATSTSTGPTSTASMSADGSSTRLACDEAPVAVGAAGETVVSLIDEIYESEGLTSVLYRVTQNGEMLAHGAVGDTMSGVPAETTLHFRNGNVAFAYMGNLMLVMAENGEVSLEDPVSRWLPDLDVPDADEVTLEMLARSTSGYPDYVLDPEFEEASLADPFAHVSPSELLERAFSTSPWYPPGTSWNYSHTNYVILGEALAAAGGKPLGDLLAEHVLEPMGLAATAPALTPAVPAPAMQSYSTERDVFENTTFWNPSWQTAPGSVLTTTICDMATSARAIGTGELVGIEGQEQVLAPVTAELGPPPETCDVCREMSESLYYGLGVIVMNGWIVQNPLFGGSGAVHAYLPEADLAVAIVAVTGPGSDAGRNHAESIWRSIAAELTPDQPPSGSR